jgi:spore germination protein YaaH
VKTIIKRIIVLSIILVVLIVPITLYFYYYPRFSEEFPEKRNFFWYVEWNNASYERLIQSPNDIDMISPVWWGVYPNGTIYNRILTYDESWNPSFLISLCSLNSIEIHPLVSNYHEDEFSGELISGIINNQTKILNFIQSLNLLLQMYNCTGINLDFEGVPSSDRTTFTSFLRQVKDEIDPKYLISIDVPAKTIDTKIGWSGAFDYFEIGQICDYVMIMTYDYSRSNSNPGQIAPRSWVRNTLRFALKHIPKESIFCGIPLYGYNWPNDGNQAVSSGYPYFDNLIQEKNVNLKRYWNSKELYFKFTDSEGTQWHAVFPDSLTINKKEELINRYPIGGYCYWYLGIGDPSHWSS